jgi:hypothetical protein
MGGPALAMLAGDSRGGDRKRSDRLYVPQAERAELFTIVESTKKDIVLPGT